MRVVFVVIAALVTLGLAAFGVVEAQKAAAPARATAALAQTPSSPPAPRAVVTEIPQASMVAVTQPAAPSAITAHTPAAVTPPPAPALAPAANAPAAPLRVAENTSKQNTADASATAASAPAPAPASAPTCDKPGGMGLARTVEIDTTGGPAFGTQHFKQYDFLRDHEVVFTFDDGPWPENTPKVLKALADMCLKATFFEIGEHASWRPDISKMVAAAGMTIGTHTWSHKNLAKNPYASDIEQAKNEIEMGVSAVHLAVGAPIAPFFRFPDLKMPPDLVTYLGTRNIAIFSADIDTVDFKLKKPDAVIKSVMAKLAKNGKGILLMHDFKPATAEAVPQLLQELKAGGYKVVHMVPKAPVETLAKYDDMVKAQDKFSSANNTRPETSVVRTINGN